MGNKVEDLYRYRLPGKELDLEELLPILPPRLIRTLLQNGVLTIGALYEACRTGTGLEFLEGWQLQQIHRAFRVWPRQHACQARMEEELRRRRPSRRLVPCWDWREEDGKDEESEALGRHWKGAREIIMLRATRTLSRASARALRVRSRCAPGRARASTRESGRPAGPSCPGI